MKLLNVRIAYWKIKILYLVKMFSFFTVTVRYFLIIKSIADMLNWKRYPLQFFCHITSEVSSSHLVFYFSTLFWSTMKREGMKLWFFGTFDIIMFPPFLKLSLKFFNPLRIYEEFVLQY